jgi:hypothetical protein
VSEIEDGPWEVTGPTGCLYQTGIGIRTANGTVPVAVVYGARDQAEPIATLMAASRDLLETLKLGRFAFGDHCAPADCYSTGPRTGDVVQDYVACPACSFIAAYDEVIAKATEVKS